MPLSTSAKTNRKKALSKRRYDEKRKPHLLCERKQKELRARNREVTEALRKSDEKHRALRKRYDLLWTDYQVAMDTAFVMELDEKTDSAECPTAATDDDDEYRPDPDDVDPSDLTVSAATCDSLDSFLANLRPVVDHNLAICQTAALLRSVGAPCDKFKRERLGRYVEYKLPLLTTLLSAIMLIIFELESALTISFDETSLQGGKHKTSFMGVDVRMRSTTKLQHFLEQCRNTELENGLTDPEAKGYVKMRDDVFIITVGYEMIFCQTAEAEGSAVQEIIDRVDVELARVAENKQMIAPLERMFDEQRERFNFKSLTSRILAAITDRCDKRSCLTVYVRER